MPLYLLLSNKRTTQRRPEMKCQWMSPIQFLPIQLAQLWAHLSSLLHRHQHSENMLVAPLQNHLRRKCRKVGKEVSHLLPRVYHRVYFPVGRPHQARVLLAKCQISFLDGSAVVFFNPCFPRISCFHWVEFEVHVSAIYTHRVSECDFFVEHSC